MPINAVLVRIALAVVSVGAFLPAYAQQVDTLGNFTNWSYLVFENPKSCAIVSRPIESQAVRDGSAVSVTRGDIRLFVAVSPGSPQTYETTFGAGYPLDQDKVVTVKIRDSEINLFPMADIDPEFAWSRPENDAALVAAMRGGSEAIVTGLSTRGTTTIDTFSLIGFTAAIERAEELCR